MPPSARPSFEDVLCAIDGGPGGFAAVEQAATLMPRGARITLLLVTSFNQEGDRRGPAIAPLEAKEILDRAREIAGRAGVATSAEVDPGAPPASVIQDWASGRDLLALGAPGPQLRDALLGLGAADMAMNLLATPLLVARPLAEGEFARRMVVASDGLDGSDQLVDFAADLARVHGSDVTLVHAIDREEQLVSHTLPAQADRLLRASAAKSEARFVPGVPRGVIVDCARELDASLIVMGSRRLSGVRLLGSVSRPVAHRAHCSVLLMPPERLRPATDPA